MLANLHRVILCYNDSFHGGVYTCGKKKKIMSRLMRRIKIKSDLSR